MIKKKFKIHNYLCIPVILYCTLPVQCMDVNSLSVSYIPYAFEQSYLNRDATPNYFQIIPRDVAEHVFRFVHAHEKWEDEYNQKIQNYPSYIDTKEYFARLVSDARDNPFFHKKIKDVFAQSSINSVDLNEALGISLRMGNIGLVHILLDAGAPANCYMPQFQKSIFYGMTPLGYAIIKDNYELAELLLKNGAHPNLITYGKEGLSHSPFSQLVGIQPCYPLEIAQKKKNVKMIRLLQDYKPYDEINSLKGKMQINCIKSGVVLYNVLVWCLISYFIYNEFCTKDS